MLALKRARLSAVALGVAVGFLKGACMLTAVLLALYGYLGADFVTHWTTMYPGVDLSVKGALIAGAWGFLGGFFAGLILAWIYNLCLCCCSRGHCSCCKDSCTSCTCNCNRKVTTIEKI